MNTKNKIIIAVIVVLVGGLSFYAGRTMKGSGQSNGMMNNNRMGTLPGQRPGMARNGTGEGFATGEVLSKDNTSITLKLRDGGSKIVFLSASTTVSRMAEVSAEELKTGSNVMVQGKTGADGSITAQSVQIRPEGVGAGMMRGR